MPLYKDQLDEILKGLKASDKRNQGWQEEQEASRAFADEEKKKEQEKGKRGFLSKAWDTVNIADSGRSWTTDKPSEAGAKKSGWQQGKEVASGLFSGVEKVGDSVEALTGISERRSKHWDKQLKEGKITQEQYQKLLDDQLKDTEWAGTEDKGTGDRLKKAAGVSLEATSEIVPFMKAGKAAQMTTKGGAIFGTLTGAAHGVGGQLNNPDGFDYKQAGVETVIGLFAGAGGGRLAQWQAGKKAARKVAMETAEMFDQADTSAVQASKYMDAEDAFKATQNQGITDPSRLLPDGSESKAMRIAEIDSKLDEIRTGMKKPGGPEADTVMSLPMQNKYAKITTKQADKLRNEVDNIPWTPDDKPHLTAGKQVLKEGKEVSQEELAKLSPNTKTALDSTKVPTTSSPTADELRALVRERKQLLQEIEAIKNPTLRTAEGMNLVEADFEKAVQAGDKAKAKQLAKELDYIQEQSKVVDHQEAIAPLLSDATGPTKTARLGQRTEAMAIEKKLADGFEFLPTYETTNLTDEAAAVITHMDNDMDEAVKIAMGQAPPPPGTTAGSFYVGVANRAAKTGDADMIRRLAEESLVSSRASRMGQEISALQNLDPESPVTAVKSVLKARRDANPKIPATISMAESTRITELSQVLELARDKAIAGGDKIAYGNARVAYDNYIQELIKGSGPSIATAIKQSPGKFAKDAIMNTAGFTKSMVATLDNSVIGRQGWKTMWTNPKTWARNSAKSFKDMIDTYGGKEVIDHVNADVVSRDNALNGMYRAMKLDVYGAKKNFLEEAFPVSFNKATKSKVGKQVIKPFKASEVAFEAWQQRTRADLADQYLQLAQNMGVDLTSKKELVSIGKMVNSLTSRGNLGSAEKWADGLNKMFFAPRLVKSHIDVMGGHVITGAGGSNFVRKQAAKNLLKISVGSAMALQLAAAATGGKLEADPRSSNFGKVRVGDTRFDLTGGMAGLVTLGSRLLTQKTKSSSTGELVQLNTGEFGSQNTYDVLLSFAENKLSPIARSATDFLKGEDFDGNKPTIDSTVKNLTVPLIIRQYEEVADNKRSANKIGTLIAEGLGISANTYSMDADWNANNGKKITAFKSKVSESSFKEANDKFNDEFIDWYGSVSANEKFWQLPQEQRFNLVNAKKNKLTEDVMKAYGFEYKQTKKSDTEKSIAEELMKYKN